ncbi:hypothetical protein PIB30_066183 [Stylosanthes scabra]|uniref:Uncharacterized protein n=1 Tax=Stylosanthes scabra TaxID=79078 RepID=A0ABU6QMQ1_9FABA|nr:hypothetical protein [Stylosanthes scabra]
MGAEKKWLFTLFTAAFLSLMIILSSFTSLTSPKPFPSIVNHGFLYPPSFAYFITGSRGDKDRAFRLLLAIYHPRNRYLLHLGKDAGDEERRRLAAAVMSVPAMQAFGNVDVVGKADYVTLLGSSNIAITLRAAAIMMKLDSGWDWFVTLSALDYPLITQDDLSHVFSSVRRDLNFIDHTSDLGSKESERIQPIVVDPAIYLSRRSQIFQATHKRKTPESFKIFTGKSTLSYSMEPRILNISVYNKMVESGAAFARQFRANDPVLDMIDEKILHRRHNRAIPGAWCSGPKGWWRDPCSQWSNVNVLRPGPQAKKLEESVSELLDNWNLQTNQCHTATEETQE